MIDPKRSALMSRIRSRDTAPELVVRRTLRRWGVGYRLHGQALPGTPDIVMAGRWSVVLVHGCFWHRHEGCSLSTNPKTNQSFWTTKFQANVARDERTKSSLLADDWKVLELWQCEIKSGEYEARLRTFLDLPQGTGGTSLSDS